MTGRPRLYATRADRDRAYYQRKKARSFIENQADLCGGICATKIPQKSTTKPRCRGRPQLYKTPAARYRAYRRRLAVKVYHKSQCATWETPPEVFGPLEERAGGLRPRHLVTMRVSSRSSH
jgi:hypothetical protein